MKAATQTFRQRKWSLAALGCAVALAATVAQAQALPAERTQGGISYVTGGVGEDEVKAIKQAASGFPLAIELVAKGTPLGEHLTDAAIDIRDARGKSVISTHAEGPFLLAKLPPGRYTVSVEWNGSVRRYAVDVASGGHQRLVVEL